MVRNLVSAILILFTVTQAFAWSECGHHMIAVMAYQQLGDANKAEVIRLIKAHPRFDQDFKVPNGVKNKDYWLIGRAAYWPDVARRFPEWNRPKWHYQLGATDVIGNVENVPADPGPPADDATLNTEDLHVLQAIKLCESVFLDKTRSDADRSVALCWLLHLIADIHQPCHAGSLYVEEIFPKGDRGANSIKVQQRGNLHALWDRLLGSSFDEGDVARRIREIAEDEELQKWIRPEDAIGPSGGVAGVAAMPKELWLIEGRDAGKTLVYARDVREPISLALRQKTSQLPEIILSQEYLKDAGRFAQLAALRAARRLAAPLMELR